MILVKFVSTKYREDNNSWKVLEGSNPQVEIKVINE